MAILEFCGVSAAVLIAGALYEGSGPLYIRFAESGQALKTALVSAGQGVCILTGVGTTVHDLRYAPAFIAGYFIGPLISVSLRHRWDK